MVIPITGKAKNVWGIKIEQIEKDKVMSTADIVQKLWNYCNVLRKAGP